MEDGVCYDFFNKLFDREREREIAMGDNREKRGNQNKSEVREKMKSVAFCEGARLYSVMLHGSCGEVCFS